MMKQLPKLFFKSQVPVILRDIIGKKIDNITLPPTGIFFLKSKDKTSKKVFKEECRHWEQAEGVYSKTGKWISYYIQYFMAGDYDSNKFEKDAKEYAASGNLTKQEQQLWDSYS